MNRRLRGARGEGKSLSHVLAVPRRHTTLVELPVPPDGRPPLPVVVRVADATESVPTPVRRPRL